MQKTRHLALSIEGALNSIRKKADHTKSFADHPDGRAMTHGELRENLYEATREGKRVLPMGGCDNFDYQTGCRGHYKCITNDIDFETGNG
jgi:hypothetical protein